MKDILHLKNIYYSKKYGFMFPYETKDVKFIEVTEGLTQMSGINDNYFKRNLDIISNNEISKTKTLNLKTTTFDEIVPQNINIDYLSIDIEGGELSLLKSINFDIFTIKSSVKFRPKK